MMSREVYTTVAWGYKILTPYSEGPWNNDKYDGDIVEWIMQQVEYLGHDERWCIELAGTYDEPVYMIAASSSVKDKYWDMIELEEEWNIDDVNDEEVIHLVKMAEILRKSVELSLNPSWYAMGRYT